MFCLLAGLFWPFFFRCRPILPYPGGWAETQACDAYRDYLRIYHRTLYCTLG